MGDSENSLMAEARPATADEAHEHLEAFIQAFVNPGRRDRWRLFMLNKPEKARRDLHKLPVDEKRATWMDPKERSQSEPYASLKGRLGIYFNFWDAPVWMLAEDAELQSGWQCQDAVFSLVPGKLAVYFNHDHVTALLRRA